MSLAEVRMNLSFYSLVFLSAFGCIGNSVIIYIFTRKKFRKYSSNVYLASLAVFDIFRLLFTWISHFTQFNLYSSVSCKLIMFLSTWLYQSSNWLPVLTALDRLFAVRFPTYYSITRKWRFQLANILGLVAFTVLSSSNILFAYDVVAANNRTACTISPVYSLDARTTSLFNLVLLPNIIPFALMILATVTLAYQLDKSRRRFKKSLKRETRFCKILVALDLYFLVFNLPFGISHFFIIYFKYYPKDIATVALVTSVFGVLSLAHSACSVLVYLAFNKEFRKRLLCFIHSKIRLYL